MSSKRKFYRTVIQVEILSETPYPDGINLEQIHHDITEGDSSGKISTIVDNQILSGEQTAILLKDQGSDPSFFQLDNEGNDIKKEDLDDLDDWV
jgi:hypothetical protein